MLRILEGMEGTGMKEIDEPLLSDDYPVHHGYLYIVNGEPRRCPVEGTVADLKAFCKVKEVRRCDIAARDLWDQMVFSED
jgi:hypothetical protein